MFKRRIQHNRWKRVREFLWPSMGWIRFVYYHFHRLGRMKESVYKISAGFAAGSAISFTPFLGLHFFLAMLLAWMTRSSFLASASGTIVGNPFTFPFIWAIVYELGVTLTGQISEIEIQTISITTFMDHPLDVFLPMVVGGCILAVPAWFITYFIVKRGIISYQKLRHYKTYKAKQHQKNAHFRLKKKKTETQ